MAAWHDAISRFLFSRRQHNGSRREKSACPKMSDFVQKPPLSPAQRRALAALAAGQSKSAAATAAGISERTLDRYLQDARFMDALNRATDEAIRAAAAGLLAGLETAVETLKTVAGDKNEAAGTRVRAAERIIVLAVELWQSHTLAERVAALEDRHSEG